MARPDKRPNRLARASPTRTVARTEAQKRRQMGAERTNGRAALFWGATLAALLLPLSLLRTVGCVTKEAFVPVVDAYRTTRYAALVLALLQAMPSFSLSFCRHCAHTPSLPPRALLQAGRDVGGVRPLQRCPAGLSRAPPVPCASHGEELAAQIVPSLLPCWFRPCTSHRAHAFTCSQPPPVKQPCRETPCATMQRWVLTWRCGRRMRRPCMSACRAWRWRGS